MEIVASPTKDFFIYMITRDIYLEKAISELVDNSVDSATSIQGNDYSGIKIELTLSRDSFTIKDNCGGMDVDTASRYAFRFGRPDDSKNNVDFSVGNFGVGMKRALFKLGTVFNVSSKTMNSTFDIEVDVNEWRRTEEWNFNFKNLFEEDGINSDSETGTVITVRELFPAISSSFLDNDFLVKLKKEIKSRHSLKIQRGLLITVNQGKIESAPIQLKISSEYVPACRIKTIRGVEATFYVGLGDRNPNEAGWYIYCNDRLIIEAERTNITGWGEKSSRKFHNDFSRVRGYVFFRSSKSNLLPWNTTKTGVDLESEVFIEAKEVMISMLKPLTDFLNVVKEDKAQDGNLDDIIDDIVEKEIFSIPTDLFQNDVIVPNIRVEKTKTNVSYKVLTKDLEKVQKKLNVSTGKDAGARTFEYYFDREC